MDLAGESPGDQVLRKAPCMHLSRVIAARNRSHATCVVCAGADASEAGRVKAYSACCVVPFHRRRLLEAWRHQQHWPEITA